MESLKQSGSLYFQSLSGQVWESPRLGFPGSPISTPKYMLVDFVIGSVLDRDWSSHLLLLTNHAKPVTWKHHISKNKHLFSLLSCNISQSYREDVSAPPSKARVPVNPRIHFQHGGITWMVHWCGWVRSSAGSSPWAGPIPSSMIADFREHELQGKKVAAAELLKLWGEKLLWCLFCHVLLVSQS